MKIIKKDRKEEGHISHNYPAIVRTTGDGRRVDGICWNLSTPAKKIWSHTGIYQGFKMMNLIKIKLSVKFIKSETYHHP